MTIIKNFKDLWYLMPFLDVLTNKISVIFSIIMGNEKIKLKIRTGNYVEIPKKNFETIINKAKENSNFLRLDMENSAQTDDTFKIYNYCKNQYAEVGIVFQAYLKRSIEDMGRLARHGFNARICKGIYKENSTIAYHDPD